MDMPVKLFTVIALILLPTVMFGGFSLLQLLTSQRLNDFQRTYFRAGHAHAGVLLVLTLVALEIMARSDLGTGCGWPASCSLSEYSHSREACSSTWRSGSRAGGPRATRSPWTERCSWPLR